MNDQDRQAIEGLFTRLGQVGAQAPERDAEAEGYIAEQLRRHPGSAYYMAQTVVVQEAALEQARRRIAELEEAQSAAPAQDGGFLSRLFGGGLSAAPPPRPRSAPRPAAQGAQGASWGPAGGRAGAAPGGAWGPAPQRGGGGFLAGAAQTAVGVAGGMMLGNMLAGAFAGPAEDLAAAAGELPEDIVQGGAQDAAHEEPHDVAQDAGFEDAGGFEDV